MDAVGLKYGFRHSVIFSLRYFHIYECWIFAVMILCWPWHNALMESIAMPESLGLFTWECSRKGQSMDGHMWLILGKVQRIMKKTNCFIHSWYLMIGLQTQKRCIIHECLVYAILGQLLQYICIFITWCFCHHSFLMKIFWYWLDYTSERPKRITAAREIKCLLLCSWFDKRSFKAELHHTVISAFQIVSSLEFMILILVKMEEMVFK